jgi:2-(1,2-epoxy-1,2-dihydrophenyl)acetyl-CoA isomerase
MSHSEFSELQVENLGPVQVLTLNRPDRFNALSRSLCEALAETLRNSASDPAVRCVVLTGAGRAFCAGGDVGTQVAVAESSEAGLPEADADGLRSRMESARLLHAMPKPTIAMINGVAAGAGMALALACDMRVASERARMTTAFAKVGLSGDYGGNFFLTRLVGTALAKELYFMSPMLEIDQLEALGLINRRVEAARLRDETLKLAGELANGPTLAYRYMKNSLNLAAHGTLEEVMSAEVFGTLRTLQSQDHREGAQAFVNKRKAVFQGR